MGLDMNLTQTIFVGAQYQHRQVKDTIALTSCGETLAIDLKKVSEVVMHIAYWRKANAIHKWFVDNCQQGRDECQETFVSHDQLVALRRLCRRAIRTKDASLLPPQEGFLFGSTEIDEGYWQDLKDTVKMLGKLDPKGIYTYRSSW